MHANVDPRRVRILVIEDDPDIMKLLETMLSNAGYRVMRAYGGQDALRKIQATIPDLIITDLAMPGMSGVELVEELKEDPDLCHIPVIAVTAFVWDGLAQAAGQAGVEAFIGKPFSAKTLLEEVRTHLVSAAEPRAAARAS